MSLELSSVTTDYVLYFWSKRVCFASWSTVEYYTVPTELVLAVYLLFKLVQVIPMETLKP